MSSTPREIGTLIVVVLRAKNLPNKRHIGKQDPYCRMTFNQETRRTKAVKRGGQHPEWDEEVRFSIYEDAEDEPERTPGDKTPPPKDRFRNIKGGKSMRVSCYADDPREPDLIGETQVDLTEALTKGEVDEWFTLQNKDKYAGEVYLEMTFWSNAKAPAKKKAPRPSIGNPHYGGPGSFTPSGSVNGNPTASSPPAKTSVEIPAFLRPNRETSPTASLPDSLKPSSSALGKPELYISPYNSQNSIASQNSLPSALEPAGPPYDDFGRLGQNPNHRRDSYPPARYDQPPSVYGHPSNGAIPQPYQQPAYDPFSASSLAQSMSGMHIGQHPAPSVFPPPSPAPSFAPSQFGYAPLDNVPPPFPQGPSYPGLGYGPPSATPMPPNGAFQPGFAPNQGNRLASAGFAAPPPIPTPMPFNIPPPVTPFQQPPNPSQTPFPQQHPYQQYPPNPAIPVPPQNVPQAGQFGPFSPPTAPPGPGMFPQQQGPPPPSASPPRGALPPVPQHQSTLPPQPQPYIPQQPYSSQAPQNPPPLQTFNSAGSSRPLPTPQQSQSPSSSSSSNLFGAIPGSFPQGQNPAPNSMFGPVPGSYPPPPANANGQQWHPPAHMRNNSLPPAPPQLPGPPPPLPSQTPQLTASPDQQNQSPPTKHFQAPPPPPNSSFQSYQNNPENQLPPPPSAYQQPPPHPQQQRQSVPIGGIFPGPSTTSVYPGPPPKPPQMVAPQHNGWQ
ncbi:unnamed protein product [Rhizoctonia solani]|uniref:C2 domain-containing protein n=1 Tax=Rhizoctonia solani TaxID=456999 RepID=A0A8H3DUC3_9AGAM|nr:unnamed protein product [Rhizoctonia solani]